MFQKKNINERRKYQRFFIKGGAYIALQPNCKRLDPIIDISMGGIAYYYVDTENKPLKNVKATIVLPDSKFSISDLPAKTVSDYEISNENDLDIPLRRRSIKFDKLSGSQFLMLEQFMQHHTESK